MQETGRRSEKIIRENAKLMATDDFDSGLATCSELPSCSSEIVCPVKKIPPPTLKQHYYPEGGWGWFIVFIAVVVHVLNHGLQYGSGVLLPFILKQFATSTYTTAGNFYNLITIVVLRHLTHLGTPTANIKLVLNCVFACKKTATAVEYLTLPLHFISILFLSYIAYVFKATARMEWLASFPDKLKILRDSKFAVVI